MSDSLRGPSRSADTPAAWRTYRYVVVRVVPRADREESVNTGVLLQLVDEKKRLEVALSDRWKLAELLEPGCDLAEMKAQLDAFVAVARGVAEAGTLAALPASERFHWLAAVRSAVVRCSQIHVGRTRDARRELQRILERAAPGLDENQRHACAEGRGE
ncbi:MAG: DUF3037 domain-containing protein [Acidobacteria bacterium]|nr:MAG: DUF3037 domain-containing protein [Acidobacteriota bacterium]REK00126.1 MAG: DUF3037 domain-containing protein [Acidobacteriota bacterium]